MDTGNFDLSAVSQVAFSIATCWYLLTSFSKKIEHLSEAIKETQRVSLLSTTETKEMFSEIRDLIKETCNLVNSTSESVRVQSELTKTALDRLEKYSYQELERERERERERGRNNGLE